MKLIISLYQPKYLIRYFLSLLFMVILLVVSPGCSKDSSSNGKKQPQQKNSTGQMIEKTGVIEEGDSTDPNHSNLPYDAYTFNAQFGDKVAVKVSTKDFIPLLKLVEVSTGAPLVEWDSKYSPGEGLTYTIAGPGEYEVRVYAMKSGTGNYSLQISVN